MIVANGVPKSGTHALMALLAMQGGKRVPGILDGFRGPRALLMPTGAWPAVPTLEQATALPHDHFLHGHVPADVEVPPSVKVVTVLRHPRNVLVSYSRRFAFNRMILKWIARRRRGMHTALGSPPTLQEILANGFVDRPFVEVYRRFLGWRGRGLVVRYEDIPRDFTAGAPDLYAGAAEDHNTLTSEPTDWREVWTPDIDASWRAAGGYELEQDAGYGK